MNRSNIYEIFRLRDDVLCSKFHILVVLFRDTRVPVQQAIQSARDRSRRVVVARVQHGPQYQLLPVAV